jgi:NNP family nitrate/nitrite transporter-like MFS transporter
MAFFIWFAITPLISEIKDTLGLTKQEIWNSSIAGVGGTIGIRLILGPLCDKYGARILLALVLCGASIPTACTGFLQSATGLVVLRTFIGLAGGSFVMCQYWTSRMFTKEIVGTANALVGGWGNLGASVTQIVIGSFLFPSFKAIFDGDAEKAWRTVSVVPAVLTFATGVLIYYHTDDSPKGNYQERKQHGTMSEVNALKSFQVASWNWNTWILCLQYACCFGAFWRLFGGS